MAIFALPEADDSLRSALQQLGTADVCLRALCDDAYILPNDRS